MKTRFYILILLPLMLLASCQQQIDSPVLPDNAFQLVAVQETGGDTKTIISGETSVYWEPAEEIKVFKADGTGYLFKSSNTEPAATAVFSGVLTTDDVTEGEELWSVYPFAEEATFDGESITTVLPSSQVARAESFGRNMNLSIARTTSRQLQFYNVGGGIRFSVTQEGISKVIFEGLNGEILSGKVTVGFENGRPVVKEVSGGSPFITLTPPDGETFQTGKWYFIVTIPGALSGGYKLRFYKADDYARRVSDTPVTIKRGIYGSLAQADASLEYESTTTSFPETEEEWEESNTMSEVISDNVSAILSNLSEESEGSVVDARMFVEQVKNIEGVADAYVVRDNVGAVILQSDGVYLNVLLNDNEESEEAEYENTVSTLSPNSFFKSRRSESSSLERKALLITPYYSRSNGIFHRIAPNAYAMHDYLQSAGYSLDWLWDDYADLGAFAPDSLDNYELIVVATHGNYGFKDQEGNDVGTVLLTGSKKESIDLTSPDYKKLTAFLTASADKHYAVSVPWFEAVEEKKGIVGEFPRSIVIAMACNTYHLDDMAEYFTGHGAGIYYGNKTTVEITNAEPGVLTLVHYLCMGMSMQNAVKLMRSSFDVAQQVFFPGRLSEEPYGKKYLINVSPMNLKPVVNGTIATLIWEMPKNCGTYEYKVHIGDKEYSVQTERGLTIDTLPAGTYSWWVEANLMVDGKVIETFTSQPGEPFTIEQTTPEPQITVSPKSLSFGSATIGRQQKELVVTITNTGTADLTISSVEEYQCFSTNFDQWTSKVIAPGKECKLKVRFRPTASRYYKNSLLICSDATNDRPYVVVSVSGTGITPSGGNYPTPTAVDLGLSVKWASFNLGAASPEEYGYFFAWGETKPKSSYTWENYQWCKGSVNTLTKYNYDSQYGEVDDKRSFADYDYADDAARVNLKGTWKTPSSSEWGELMSKSRCNWTWVDDYQGTGVSGFIITSKNSQYAGNSIFLPIAGPEAPRRGYYWESVIDSYDSNYGAGIGVDSSGSGWGASDRCYGLPIRPVLGN